MSAGLWCFVLGLQPRLAMAKVRCALRCIDFHCHQNTIDVYYGVDATSEKACLGQRLRNSQGFFAFPACSVLRRLLSVRLITALLFSVFKQPVDDNAELLDAPAVAMAQFIVSLSYSIFATQRILPAGKHCYHVAGRLSVVTSIS